MNRRSGSARRLPPAEPQLVLFHGFYEGRAFPLRRAELEGDGGSVLGRKAEAQGCLGYDPHVSLEDREVLPAPEGFELTDLRGSKNGTFLTPAASGATSARA